MGKILIVDDAMFMREIIRGILNTGGYDQIIEAEDGTTALELFQAEKPELTILDITMPNMNGLDTLSWIKHINANAKVIICSAIGQDKQIMKAMEMGAADYIVKPFKPDQMLAAIKKVLG